VRKNALPALFAASLLAGCGPVEDTRSATAGPPDPETTYRRYCYSCHASGAAGAPRLGDAEAWAPRVAQGWKTLFDHTLNGLRGMPPRGLCRQCSDDELDAVLRWMLAQSGGLPADAPSIAESASESPISPAVDPDADASR
jgi:cytochrome c5